MKKAVLIVVFALAAVVLGTLVYAKFFVTPLDKEGMVYTPPEEGGEEKEQDEDEKPPPPPVQTAEEQIGLFLAQKALWFQGGPEYAPACLYYAVTDLNQNGRLELIRSEFRYDTNASINRFYEIDEAMTGVRELPYDLASNGEDTASPGLVNAELPAMCFFRDGIYRYSVPSPIEGAENLAIEFFFMLCIDREGSVTTELLGEKWLNRATGEASYLRGTEEIAQRDYDGADFFRYGGDDCCECTWEWVELLEGWNEADQRQALTDSWENFVFDTLGILNR